ncbi:hypothetical protein B481_2477 [Planococcus halocryophilus Or1]|nr:hypothetical protein B481_2477 [Planococcus halocryophilus Or1]
MSGGLRTVLENTRDPGEYTRAGKLPRGGETLVRVPQNTRVRSAKRKKPPTQVRG